MTASCREDRVRLAFLGCGFITGVHSRCLRSLADRVVCSYASRSAAKAEEFRARFAGRSAYEGYASAIEDPDVDVVVVATPPHLHLELTRQALAAGKHVLVEKPALLSADDYRAVIGARDAAGRCVLVGENDHYKPLAVTLRRLLAERVIGDLVLASFITIAERPKQPDDWRNDAALAGGDAFFEEGIHWLHLAGSLGPRITRVSGHRPAGAATERHGDRRRRSMLVGFDYDNGAVGALLYSREVPSLLRGARVSKLYGREGVISFESNGAGVLVRGRGRPRVIVPGWRDIRGYRAMYADLLDSIRADRQPQMSLERALEDHLLMESLDG